MIEILQGTDGVNPALLSGSTLAFLGDGVYELMAREYLVAAANRPAGQLHALNVRLVNAGAQADGATKILPILKPEELSVFKRGRNVHTAARRKSADLAGYHQATGLEALFGYLYLCRNFARLQELFKIITEDSQILDT